LVKLKPDCRPCHLLLAVMAELWTQTKKEKQTTYSFLKDSFLCFLNLTFFTAIKIYFLTVD